LSPAKPAFTGSDAAGWLTGMMTQLAEPDASVVAVQLWAVVPEPRVSVTSSARRIRHNPGEGRSQVCSPGIVMGKTLRGASPA